MAFQLATNLDLGAQLPLDARSVVSNQAERNALVTSGKAHPGLIVYITGENKYYSYNTNSQWVELNITGGGGGGQTPQLTNVVFTTGDQNISGLKSFSNICLSGNDLSQSSLKVGEIIGISGKNVRFDIGSQTLIDNGLIMTIHSGSGTIGGGNAGQSRAISFLRGNAVQGARSSYGIVFSGSSINFDGIRGYLTRSLLSPQDPGAIALDQATLVWTDRILSGQWNTNQRLLVNGTGVLLQGESATGLLGIYNYTFDDDDLHSYLQQEAKLNNSPFITGIKNKDIINFYFGDPNPYPQQRMSLKVNPGILVDHGNEPSNRNLVKFGDNTPYSGKAVRKIRYNSTIGNGYEYINLVNNDVTNCAIIKPKTRRLETFYDVNVPSGTSSPRILKFQTPDSHPFVQGHVMNFKFNFKASNTPSIIEAVEELGPSNYRTIFTITGTNYDFVQKQRVIMVHSDNFITKDGLRLVEYKLW